MPELKSIPYTPLSFDMMEANSSQARDKGKGRATEYSHLPASCQNDPERQEEPSDPTRGTGADANMAPLDRVGSHSEDEPATDNLGGIDQQHKTLQQHRVLQPDISQKTRLDTIGGVEQKPTDGAGDTDTARPTNKRRISFQENPPSPPPQRLRRPRFEERFEKPPSYSALPGRHDGDDIDVEVTFQQAPATTTPRSPHPRHRELHPIHVLFGEGNLQVENIMINAEEADVEECEDIDDDEASEESQKLNLPEHLDERSMNIGWGSFYLCGSFQTRLARWTWVPSLSRHFLEHPSTNAMFDSCFSEAYPVWYRELLERHRGQ